MSKANQITQKIGGQTPPHVNENGVEYIGYTHRSNRNHNGREAFITTVKIIDYKTKRRTVLNATSGYKQGGVLETRYTNDRAWIGYSTRVKEFDTLEGALLALKKRIESAMPKEISEKWVDELFETK